jgi:hypothetical protein
MYSPDQAIKAAPALQLRSRRFSDEAQTVAKLLHASGHTPDLLTFITLRIIAKRLPALSFEDFVSGAMLALTMEEAATAERGHG